MTLRTWVLVGAGVVFALTANHAFASETTPGSGKTGSEVPAVQPRAAKNSGKVKAPRPRPAGSKMAGDTVAAAESDQCRWLGTRIVSLLSRDDAMAAENFNPFYEQFGCPEAHLSEAFGCVVGGHGQSQGEDLASRVDRCWADPVAGRMPKSVTDESVSSEAEPEKTEPETTEPEMAEPEKPADGGT